MLSIYPGMNAKCTDRGR